MSMGRQGRIALKNHVLHGLVSVELGREMFSIYHIDYVISMISMEAENSMAYPKLYSKSRSNAPGLEMKMLASYVM